MAVASLGGLMRVKKIQMALVVAPLSVLAGWEEEAKKVLPKFSPSVRVMVVHKGTAKERQMIMRNAWKSSSLEQPYVIISTWGLVTSEKTVSTFLPPSGHHWSFVTLDEAHIIKVRRQAGLHTLNLIRCSFYLRNSIQFSLPSYLSTPESQ